MRNLKLAYGVVSALLITTTNVWAAAGTRQDNSGIFVWAFLGLCALIVVAQTIPALFMVVGAVRGIIETMQGQHKVAVDVKTEGGE